MAPLGAELLIQTLNPYYDMSKFFPFSDITRLQNIFQIHSLYHIKPSFVKPCYNGFMGRNHFSKHGGPYFIHDGFSKHTHSHEDPNDIKPDKKLFYSIAIGFGILISAIGSILYIL